MQKSVYIIYTSRDRWNFINKERNKILKFNFVKTLFTQSRKDSNGHHHKTNREVDGFLNEVVPHLGCLDENSSFEIGNGSKRKKKCFKFRSGALKKSLW